MYSAADVGLDIGRYTRPAHWVHCLTAKAIEGCSQPRESWSGFSCRILVYMYMYMFTVLPAILPFSPYSPLSTPSFSPCLPLPPSLPPPPPPPLYISHPYPFPSFIPLSRPPSLPPSPSLPLSLRRKEKKQSSSLTWTLSQSSLNCCTSESRHSD